jgi:glucokinase
MSTQTYTLAIDLGGTNTKFALITKNHQVLKELTLATHSEAGPKAACQRWVNAISDWRNNYTIDLVGIGSPGPLDTVTGEILVTPNLKNWEHFSFTDFFKTQLGVPTFIENDGNCAALGEWSQDKSISDLVVLTLGTGIGCGVISGGKLVRGAFGWAVEAGHMTIDMKGPLCECGKRGCLEVFVGGAALVKRYNEKAPKKLETLTPQELFNRARLGEELALNLVHSWTEGLAIGIGNLLNLFNPTKVILTGGISPSFSFVEERFKKNLLTQAFVPSIKCTEIVVSKLQNKAGLLGAALWAQQNG